MKMYLFFADCGNPSEVVTETKLREKFEQNLKFSKGWAIQYGTFENYVSQMLKNHYMMKW